MIFGLFLGRRITHAEGLIIIFERFPHCSYARNRIIFDVVCDRVYVFVPHSFMRTYQTKRTFRITGTRPATPKPLNRSGRVNSSRRITYREQRVGLPRRGDFSRFSRPRKLTFYIIIFFYFQLGRRFFPLRSSFKRD